jgi:putative membrane protein
MFWGGAEWGVMSAIWGLLVFTFWIVVIVIVVRLLRHNATHVPPVQSSSLTVLEERYARGEITREEFTERRAVLRGET